jgi:hypothetical protein
MIHAHDGSDPDVPYRLESAPSTLWDMDRLVRELRADDQSIRRWVRVGKLPGPILRRGGRAYWSPADVEPFQRRRFRRLGIRE